MKSKALLYIAAMLLAWASISYAATTELVSVDSSGNQSNNRNFNTSISADGRYVAYSSHADNLVSGDTNGFSDVFVHNRKTGITKRVSVDSNGNQANSYSYLPDISADGRYVAFMSNASNLVPYDTNNEWDIFVHDCETGDTERVSVASNGKQANAWSDKPKINADGRYVAFASAAYNLVPGDTNRSTDIFVHDRETGVTERVSVDSSGNQSSGYLWSWWFPIISANSDTPAISADGRYVAFMSHASNLVAGDTNNYHDVFVHDRETGVTERVSVADNGNQAKGWSAWPSLSADGRYVAFDSIAANLVQGDTGANDIFVHDRNTGVTERVSVSSNGTQTSSSSYNPSISADGRYVAFASYASNLVPGDTNGRWDVFVHDRETGVTERVSVDSNGNQSVYGSGYYWWYYDWHDAPSMGADGKSVAFVSGFSDLTPADTNGTKDIFVRDMGPNCTEVPEFEIISFGPEVIWPPSHKEVQLTVSGRVVVPEGCSLKGASYTFYDQYTSSVEGVLDVDEENGNSFTFVAEVEAWRDGVDREGRVYGVSFTAEDEAGVGESGWLDSIVPHDRRKK